jgi:hypothetical protein
MRVLVAAFGLFASAAPTAFAQKDPFQSEPGPAPPAPAPRPHPVYRPRPGPELPQPAMAPPAPVPAPPDPAKRFDGLWAGRYWCDAFKNFPTFQKPLSAQVKGGVFSFINSLAAGTPGYWAASATIGPDGSVALNVDAISTGIAGTQHASGEHFTRSFRGNFNGDQFHATDAQSGSRPCGLTMSRRQ